jgi:hypothetical protein
MQVRRATFAIIAAAVLSLLPPAVSASKKKQELPKIDPSTLVWPMPPDKPRVRFIEAWENNLQIEPIRKRSWPTSWLASVTRTSSRISVSRRGSLSTLRAASTSRL